MGGDAPNCAFWDTWPAQPTSPRGGVVVGGWVGWLVGGWSGGVLNLSARRRVRTPQKHPSGVWKSYPMRYKIGKLCVKERGSKKVKKLTKELSQEKKR